jgi:hypothetical protein
MELKLKLYNFISLNLNEFTTINNLVAMITTEHKQYIPTVEQG